jgi:hypothetical protein
MATTADQDIRYLQLVTGIVNGPSSDTRNMIQDANGGERIFNIVTKAGVSLPVNDDGTDSELPFYPTKVTITNNSYRGQSYLASDSPDVVFVNNAIAKSFKQVDYQMSFMMYLVVKYSDGTIYSIGNWNWDAYLYAHTWVAGTGMTVIDPLSKVTTSSFNRTNDDPSVTTLPLYSESVINIEIT